MPPNALALPVAASGRSRAAKRRQPLYLFNPLLADTTLPSGAQVTAGSASFNQSASSLTVHQGSQQLITNWQRFSIGEGATVTFKQPGSNAVALNREHDRLRSQVTDRGHSSLFPVLDG